MKKLINTTEQLSDEQLVQQAHENAPSLPRLERAIAKRGQIMAELEGKQRQRDAIEKRFIDSRTGRSIGDDVARILQSPLDTGLFTGEGEISFEDRIRQIDHEHEALRRAVDAIGREVEAASVEVSREVAQALHSRHCELVQKMVAAFTDTVETMRAERSLQSAVAKRSAGWGGFSLPSVAFWGLLSGDSNFSAFEAWKDRLRQAGFDV